MSEQTLQLNIAVCDDDTVMVRILEQFCRRTLHPRYDLQVISAQSPGELRSSAWAFDIALLDVQLLEENGIALAREILLKNPACQIIFVSGYVHVVSDVYEVKHLGFVLKEQLESKLPPFLLRAAELAAEEAGSCLRVKAGRETEALPLSSILCLERRGHWTYITDIHGRVIETREKLTDLHSRLGRADFVRCHVSYIANLRYAVSLEKKTLLMETGIGVPISRPHEEEVHRAFFRHLSS